MYLAFVLQHLGLTDFASFNIHLLLVLTLAGFFTYLYVSYLTNNRLAGFFAGLCYAGSNYILYAYFWGHSNTMAIHWLPLIFYFIEKTIEKKNYWNSVGLSVALLLQLISSAYMTIFASFYLPLYILLRLPKINKHFVIRLGLSFILFLLVSSPFLLSKVQTEGIPRTLEENNQDYWRLSGLGDMLYPSGFLHPGLLPIIGLVATFPRWKSKQYKKKYLSFAILVTFVFLAMIGPISIFLPYYWLFQFWPYFDYLRVPFRQFPFFMLPILMLAATSIPKNVTKKQVYIITALFALQIALLLILNQHHIYYPTPMDILTAPNN